MLGIYRKGSDLKRAFETLTELSEKDEVKRDKETHQIILSIMLMVQAALLRKESRGTHMRIDYPDTMDEFKKEIIL